MHFSDVLQISTNMLSTERGGNSELTSRLIMWEMLNRVMEEIWRSMKKAFLDWLKKFGRNSSSCQHVPEYQSLKLKLLPLSQAEEATHP
jgi:hypothetical protein